VLGLATFLVVESRSRVPLIDLALFRIREFSLMIAAGTVGNIGTVVVIFLSMLLLQDLEGFTSMEAGVAFLAFSGGITLTSQLSGRLERYPSWAVMTTALAVGGAATVGMGILHDRVALFIALSAFAGLGLGMCWTFASVVTQSVVPPEKAGAASGVVLTVMIGCGGVAIAVASSIVEGRVAGGAAAEGSAIGLVLVLFGLASLLFAPVVAALGRRPVAPTADGRDA
jgi:MFS family permease